MPCKANIRQVGDVAIVDLSGRITLGDGSGVVRETVKDMLKGGPEKPPAESRRCELYRQLRSGRVGRCLRYGCEPRRPDQAAQRAEESGRSFHDNEALHGIRVVYERNCCCTELWGEGGVRLEPSHLSDCRQL